MSDAPRISLVVARAQNGVIGRDGDLPWRLSADLKYFKRLTMGKPIVMGRKTYESLGRPLPGRHNIVLTRDPQYQADGCDVVSSLDKAIEVAGSVEEVMIIGGAEIYALALPIISRAYITEVELSPDGDTVFPQLDEQRWQETDRQRHDAHGDQPAFSFVIYDRLP